MRRFASVLVLVVVLGVLQQQLCLATQEDNVASNEELKTVAEIMQIPKATEDKKELPAVVPAEAPAEVLPILPAIVPAEAPAEVPPNVQREVPAEVPEMKNHTLAVPETKNPLDEANSKELAGKASLPEYSRKTRQLWFSPNMLYLQPRVGMDGDKCVTNAGLPGKCVRFGQCLPKYGRQSRLLAYVTLREWSIPVPSIGDELCSFYDQFGRANSGVCCPQSMQYPGVLNPSFNPGFNNLIPFDLGGGLGPFPGAMPQFPSVQPIPQPPTMDGGPQKMDPEYTDDDTDVIDNPSPDDPLESLGGDTLNKSNENEEQENVIYDPVEDPMDPMPMTYNDMRYQWASQFPGHFNGIQQWPPPLPTHPPSHGSWPPPIPTHPPNHHYPTHPPSSSSSSGTHPTTTKRPPTKHPMTTTTRRYPGFPQHPMHPTPSPTTTTKRPPTSLVPSGGSSSHGLPSQCGIKNPAAPDQERIVGGINASPHEFPWIAVLFKSGKQFCGGSLITPNHILTAAHCVARMTSWDVAAMTAHLGDYNIRTDYEVQHVQRRIKRLVRHKGFTFSTLHNDIAILTVNEPVKFSREIQPICLPTSTTQQTRSYSGQVATVAGWGSLRENGPQPSTLQKVQIPIWTNGECARKYGGAAPAGIIESMLCAGQAAKDSCSGDSGGPLIVNESGRYTQVGIVSWGIGCGKGEYPGVYTRVTSLLPWIYKNIK